MRIRWYHRFSNSIVLGHVNCPTQMGETCTPNGRRSNRKKHLMWWSDRWSPKTRRRTAVVQGHTKQNPQKYKHRQMEGSCKELKRVKKSISKLPRPWTNRKTRSPRDNFDCPECGRRTTSRKGLLNHTRTHNLWCFGILGYDIMEINKGTISQMIQSMFWIIASVSSLLIK